MTKIETEWQNAEQERQEDFIQHEPPEVEFVFYNQVQQGDVFVVPTYTAMMAMRPKFAEHFGKEAFWK